MQPKVMEVLVFLARNAGRVVSRDEIVDTVWRGSVVTDEALTRCISELRSTFNDRKKEPKFIQTIPKRGYQLVAPTATLGEPVTEHLPDSAPNPEPPQELGFWAELNRRHVVRVAVAYLVVAWAILGGADLVADILNLPDSTLRYVFLALIIIFPIVTILAWTFQVTENGVVVDTGLTGASGGVRRRRLNIVILVSAAIAAGIWFFQRNIEPVPIAESSIQAGGKPSVAVLRFRTIGDDPVAKRLSDGLGVEISNQLYASRLVRVPAREWTWSLQDPQQAKEKLAVDHVVSGTIQVEDDRVRANIELVKTNSEVVWRDQFEKQFSSFFELQSEIAQTVLTELKVTFAAEADARQPQNLTDDADAYLAYLEGTYFLREPETIGTLNRARESFENALGIDLEFGAAYAGLCDTFVTMYRIEKSPQLMNNAEQTCNRAVDLSEDSEHVLIALARLYRHLGRYQEAKQTIDEARGMRQDSYEALLESGAIYQALNRTDDAITWYEQAKQLEPLYWKSHKQLGVFYVVNGELDKAVTELTEVTRLAPDDPRAFSDLGGVLQLKGDFNGAKNAYEQSLKIGPTRAAYANTATMYFYMGNFKAASDLYQQSIDITPDDHIVWGNLADAQRYGENPEDSFGTYQQAIRRAEAKLEVNPNDGETLSDLAYYYASVGEFVRASEMIVRARELAPQDLYMFYRAALIYAQGNDPERALQSLESAVTLGYPTALLPRDPGLETIKEEPQFRQLLQNY